MLNHVLLTYLLTPWCRVLLEKLTGLQLVKKSPAFLWNTKVHYLTHKRPPTVPILGQPNPVHIPTSHLLEIHPNIIHPSTPRSPQWSLSLRFPHQDPTHPPLLTHMRHMPSPSAKLHIFCFSVGNAGLKCTKHKHWVSTEKVYVIFTHFELTAEGISRQVHTVYSPESLHSPTGRETK